MSQDAWSSERRGLPRVEELPVAEQGYERDAVRQAFDAFYRHIAQLDSTLKTLEAVEVFHRQAGELRTELRALRAAGWSQQSWTSSSYAAVPADRRALRPLVPPALPRIAAEVAFIIVVAVVAGVGHFSATLIVVMLAAAWAIVGFVEWFASRERIPPPLAAPAPAVIEGTLEPAAAPAPPPEPAPEPQPAAEYGWSAFSEPADAAPGPDAMTMAGGAPEAEAEPEGEPEPVAEAEREPPAPQPEIAPAEEPRRRWFRRRRDEPEDTGDDGFALPTNVRVLSAEEREQREWADAPLADEELEPSESTDEDAVGPLRRFRRR